jgi:alpha-1,2-mannosyltransferase
VSNAGADAATLFDRSALRWLILAAGIAAVLYAYKFRQPFTTSDFTIFYQSTAGPRQDMYKGFRVNLNPPHFQLLIEPLTRLPMPVAAEVWRGLSFASLCGCLLWLARASRERWSAADVGAVLAWAPLYHVVTLNQLTWILWPLLIAAWWYWRQGRWTAGAVAFGIAFSFKSFLGVFLIWLALRRQWRALAVSLLSAAAALAVGIAAYGLDVFLAWTRAMSGVAWSAAWTNASLRAILLRTMSSNSAGAVPLVDAPALVTPLFLLLAVTVVLVTCGITRDRSVDDSWPALAASALLASPLGWVYYAWWILPGTKPSRLLVRSPLLWIPMIFINYGQPSAWATVTFSSMYVWGLVMAWAGFLYWPSSSVGAAAGGHGDNRPAQHV